MLLVSYVCFHIFSKVKVTEWPLIGNIAAHSAYGMFSWYKYLIVSLVFSHLGFWSGNLFLIAPFPDLCLLVPVNDNTRCTTVYWFYGPCITCAIILPPSEVNIVFPVLTSTCNQRHCQATRSLNLMYMGSISESADETGTLSKLTGNRFHLIEPYKTSYYSILPSCRYYNFLFGLSEKSDFFAIVLFLLYMHNV